MMSNLDNRKQIIARPPEIGKEPEVFDDVFTKQELKAVFSERANQFEGIKIKAEEFIERLDSIVSGAHKVKKEEKKKERIKEYREKLRKIIKTLKRTDNYDKEEEVRDYGPQGFKANPDDVSTK